jgi:hypothetical protein
MLGRGAEDGDRASVVGDEVQIGEHPDESTIDARRPSRGGPRG